MRQHMHAGNERIQKISTGLQVNAYGKNLFFPSTVFQRFAFATLLRYDGKGVAGERSPDERRELPE
jgi:hypothetical protein